MAFETDEDIRARAYHLWEANGRPEGRDLEFWEEARQSLSQNEAGAKSERGAKRSKRTSPAMPTGAKRTRRSAKPGRASGAPLNPSPR
jgi:Protein of unknown function (DUF2934)